MRSDDALSADPSGGQYGWPGRGASQGLNYALLETRMAKNTLLKEIRQAIADYMDSEGCSCCQGDDHAKHERRLAELLDVPLYDDKSGYDFTRFRSASTGDSER